MRKDGRGRAAALRKKRRNREFLIASILTALNLLVSLALRASDRKQALQAIRNEEKLTLLYTGEKNDRDGVSFDSGGAEKLQKARALPFESSALLL